MTSSVAVVAGGLVGLGAAGMAAGTLAVSARRDRPYLPGSHAEPVPGRRDPLRDALHHGYASVGLAVEVGADGRLRLTGDDPPTVRDAVLEPLVGRRRYPTLREPLALLVEPRGEPVETYAALDYELRAYHRVLTRYSEGEVVQGPVTVLLTGPDCPRELLATQQTRYAFVVGTFADIDSSAAPPALVPLVSEHVAGRFGWDGRDEMPAEERHLLRVLVRAAHADRRRVRFSGIPARPRRARRAFWRELSAAGVDLIGTADLGALARQLRGPRLTIGERSVNRTRTPWAGEAASRTGA